MTAGVRKRPRDITRERRPRPLRCQGHLILAPLWVAYEANLGTLLRTCDAVGACLAVPGSARHRQALDRGDTLRRRCCIHWVGGRRSWIDGERRRGARVLGVELADDATPLVALRPAGQRTVVLLGHEHSGIPDEVWDRLDEVVEIPMVGAGSSLNVAVAGSLVAYRLAGMS